MVNKTERRTVNRTIPLTFRYRNRTIPLRIHLESSQKSYRIIPPPESPPPHGVKPAPSLRSAPPLAASD